MYEGDSVQCLVDVLHTLDPAHWVGLRVAGLEVGAF